MEKYVVSARKYRPIKFEDVVGQSHVTTTLENAIKKINKLELNKKWFYLVVDFKYNILKLNNNFNLINKLIY